MSMRIAVLGATGVYRRHLLPRQGVVAEAIAAVLSMETTIEASKLDWVILRGGLFYGPGTGLDDDWFARARAGKLRLPGDGNGFISLIHIADMADATLAAITAWPSRNALIELHTSLR